MADRIQAAPSLDHAESECSAASSSYTASLLQSAAKSVLDTSTQSVVSDDDDDILSDGSNDDGIAEQLKGSATLKSLKTETLPALPNDQDRKRFIGCLAAVLASSYEYDFSDEGDELDNSAAYLEVYVREEEGFYNSTRSMSTTVDDDDDTTAVPPSGMPRFDSNLSVSFDYDDEDLLEEFSEKLEDEEDDGAVQGEQQEQEQRKKELLEEFAEKVPDEEGGRAVQEEQQEQQKKHLLEEFAEKLPDEEGDGAVQEQRKKQLLEEFAEKVPDEEGDRAVQEEQQEQRKKEQKDEQEATAAEVNKTSSALSLTQSNKLFQTTRDASMLKLALQRHRKRRYRVSSNVLLNAAKFLHVDSFQSKAFLPLLARLLRPPSKAEHDKKNLDLLGIDKEDFLWPFLESLTPGAGFRCLTMLLMEHLLRGEEGYDSRVRRVYKKLAVLIIIQDGEYKERGDCQDMTEIEFATRKFEAVEHGIAAKILALSGGSGRKSKALKKGSTEGGITKEQVMRGLKVGSAGILAGTLFAVTGGLAAPGIAAGIAAVAGSAAAAGAAVVVLTSTVAVTTIFGVGGAGLAAYKMHRRQRGLTEFEFQKESGKEEGTVEAELFTTICISGWIRDRCDFQRPWGVQPSDPPIRNKLELLERFYSVIKPQNISRCKEILSRWKGQETKLWSVFRQKYGRDPSHLFPLENGPRDRATLTVDQSEVIRNLFVELGYVNPEAPSEGETPFEKMKTGWRSRFAKAASKEDAENSMKLELSQSISLPGSNHPLKEGESEEQEDNDSRKDGGLPVHVKTVWDYQHTYGGELYTVRFESDLLAELCNSVEDVAVDAVSNATQHILKATIFYTLLTAVAIPTALVKFANMIDGSWTLAIERSDEAGKELAKSLLFSQAGRRPVTLIGYSMGARVIYACLKEMAVFQEKWEAYRERLEKDPTKEAAAKKKGAQQSVFETMREPASIIEDVILMGMPNHLSMRSWYLARQLVAGRLINCYSKKDLVLTLMFRFKKITGGIKPVCGTSAIKVPGVENYDVSDLVSAHSQYSIEAGAILKRIGHGQPIRASLNTPVAVIESEEEQNTV